LTFISNTTNQVENKNGKFELFNLEYSEYIKTEFDYIKHWDQREVLAVRTFFGIAIPFGSDYIPFSRSYFLVVQMTTELGNLIVLDLEAVEQRDDFNKYENCLQLNFDLKF
jgi:hypothetical protein